MNQQTTKMLIGAVIAAALAIATYYGVISQQQAGNLQNQANQALGTGPVSQQQPANPAAQGQAPTPAPASPAAPGASPGLVNPAPH